MQSAFLVCLGGILVLTLVLLQSLVLLGLKHELLKLFLLSCLRAGGLRLQAREVSKDDLQEVHDIPPLREHALVWLLECLWCVHSWCLLRQGSGLSRLCVELLQHSQCLLNCNLCLLCLLDCLLVALLGGHAVLSRCCHGCLQLLDCSRQVGNVLSELRYLCSEVLGFCSESIDLLSLLVTGLLICDQLRVAPSLVLRLRCGLFHQLDNEVLDELFNLLEGVCCHALRDLGQQSAPAEASTIR
mmetsp:Transcript_130938/g.318094  ORF Transcript_130938/g.318094 Transcript_130938/m.318094 type:complete len:243 (+) Transcript_130938:179-907(+)